MEERFLKPLARLAGVIWRTPKHGLALLKRSWARHWVPITATLVIVFGLAAGLWMDGHLIWGAAPTGSHGAYEAVGAPVVTIPPDTSPSAANEPTPVLTTAPRPIATRRPFQPAWTGDKFGRVPLGESTGRTLYVATTGDNRNLGTTPDAALGGPQAALDRAKPGDVICVAPGTYEPTIEVDTARGRIEHVLVAKVDGRPGAPITMSSCGGRVIFAGRVFLANRYFRLDGITVSGNEESSVKEDGAGITVAAGKNAVEPDWLELRDVRIVGFLEAGFRQEAGSNVTLVGVTAEGIGRFGSDIGHGFTLAGGNGTIVANSLAQFNQVCGIYVEAAAVGVQVVNDTVVENGGSGACIVEGARVMIANSIFTGHNAVDNDAYGYAVRGKGATVRCSLAWDNARKAPFDVGRKSKARKLTDSPYLNAEEEDYTPSGAVVDRGLDWGLLHDHAGNRRDDKRPDIGAFEASHGDGRGPRCTS